MFCGINSLRPEYSTPRKISSSQMGARITTEINKSSVSAEEPWAEVIIAFCHSVIFGSRKIRELIRSVAYEKTTTRIIKPDQAEKLIALF